MIKWSISVLLSIIKQPKTIKAKIIRTKAKNKGNWGLSIRLLRKTGDQVDQIAQIEIDRALVADKKEVAVGVLYRPFVKYEIE